MLGIKFGITGRSRRAVAGSVTAMAASAMVSGVFAVPAAAQAPASAGVSAAVTASTSAAACRTAWGTGAKGARFPAMSTAPITAVRAGRHPCFDRVVIDVKGGVARGGVSAAYVSQVYQDGSGYRVPLRGGARLRVTIGNVVHDRNGRIVYNPRNPRELVPTRGYRTLRQVALAGSFEGVTTLGVGVAQKKPYRLFVVDGARGDRVVLDIAHR
ncbi:AMIN-like domain-containing (lipo)protein [Mobilicoccus caccae]|uniref:AMIN-like domain-containing protein n=1 Tax=Mobilicoccus caccae TaxID=1859295 RepID=A0ABQ6IU39_9MICO|nr:hypothetical protein [Mobilicoccus caccae]GMA40252.1 hypothetical protein GCM10025883_22970 [Mobilicoccus caccae]